MNALEYEIDDFINRLHKEINNPLITIEEVSEIIHNLFNDNSVTELELSIIYRIFGVDSKCPIDSPKATQFYKNDMYFKKPFYIRRLQDFKTYTNADELKQDLKYELEIKYETAKYAIIAMENEFKNNTITIKNLDTAEQITVSRNELLKYIV